MTARFSTTTHSLANEAERVQSTGCRVAPRLWSTLSALALATITTISHAFAGTPTDPAVVEVRVEAKPEPKRAIGLVLSAGETVEIPETTIKKVGDRTYSITFIVDRSKIRKDTVATAMAFDENGDVVYANVSPELLAPHRALINQLPECPPDDPTAIVAQGQIGPLQQLVQVRGQRAELTRFKISRTLDEDFLLKLQQFEDAFGLEKGENLSASLPAETLVDRLTRISLAVKKYRAFKTPRNAATQER